MLKHLGIAAFMAALVFFFCAWNPLVGIVLFVVAGAVFIEAEVYKWKRQLSASVWNGGICHENGLPWRAGQGKTGSRVYKAGSKEVRMYWPYPREIMPELVVVVKEQPG